MQTNEANTNAGGTVPPVIGRLPDGTPIRLRVHPEVLASPGYTGLPEFETLCMSVAEIGVIDALLVHCTGELDVDGTGAEWADVVAGRHRFLAAELAIQNGLSPVIPCTETTTPVRTLIKRTLLDRWHLTKGARAYVVWPLIAGEVEENKERVKGNLKKGRTRLPTELAVGKTIAQHAQENGFSDELLNQARQLHEVFATRKDLREEFEPGILSGDTGLGAALAGIAGKTSTEGKARKDAPHVTLLGRAFKDLRNRFDQNRWQAMPAEDRALAESAAVECVLTWPEEVRARLRKAL